MTLLHVFFYANLLTLGLAAEEAKIEMYIAAAKETVNFIQGLTTQIIDEAKKTRDEISRWRNEIENVSEDKLEEFSVLVAVAADQLESAERAGQDILANLLRKTNVHLKLLHSAFAKPDANEFWETLECVKLTMTNTLNSSIRLLNPLIDQVATAKNSIVQVVERSEHWADKINARMTDKQLEADKHDIRSKVFGGCAASAAAGPVGLIIAYSIAVPIVETKINEWEELLAKAKAAIGKIRSKLVALHEKSKDLHKCAEKAETRMKKAQVAMISAEGEISQAQTDADSVNAIFWKEIVLPELENLKGTLEEAIKL